MPDPSSTAEREQFKVTGVTDLRSGSRLKKYGLLVVGSTGFWSILRYELIMFLCQKMPGLPGLFLRSKLYPRLLGKVGKGVVFGRNVTLRHPKKIYIGDGVIVDDNCLLDAKGSNNEGIRVGDGVFIGRGTILSCKDGDIVLEDHVNLGFYCYVYSNSRVEVGAYTGIGAYTYLVGGGSYSMDDLAQPICLQTPMRSLGGIRVGRDGWIGAGVSVMDGISIGRGVAVGAGAVVTKDLEDFDIAVGVPAKVVDNRQHRKATSRDGSGGP